MFGRLVNAFCFWLLALLALVLFALAVIQRPYQEYQHQLQVESDMRDAVQRLQDRVAANEAKIDDLDPKHPNALMVDRLAEDILGWEFRGGREVPTRRHLKPVELDATPSADDSSDDPAGQRSLRDLIAPLTSSRAWQRLPDPRVQRLQLFMAAVAISMAFIFFGAPTKHPRPPGSAPDQGPDPEGF